MKMSEEIYEELEGTCGLRQEMKLYWNIFVGIEVRLRIFYPGRERKRENLDLECFAQKNKWEKSKMDLELCPKSNRENKKRGEAVRKGVKSPVP